MKAASLPNLNREPTSYENFFTLFQDPNHHDDTTLYKRPNIDHSQVTEPSETSPFKGIPSPFVSFNGSNENHYPVGGYFDEWDQNQMDQTLPKLFPSPTRSYDTTVSVGSNPFSGNVGARSEGPNFTQLRWDQTLPNTSSVGSAQLSGNVGARSQGPNVTQLRGDQTQPSMSSVGSYQSSGNVGARSAEPIYTQLRWRENPVVPNSVPNSLSQASEPSIRAINSLDSAGPIFSQSELPRDKRRVTTQTWTPTTSVFDDGFSWRKYGQKHVLNDSHPRGYYRCAYRHDQGCPATKLVERTDEDPPMFQTTYRGNHTCRFPLKASQLIQESVPLDLLQKTDEDPPIVTTQTWTTTTSDLDDGFSWRKIEQKDILGAKHPREYFRCTQKFDKGCRATKRVQKTDEDPPMYQITYRGYHTCRNLLS